MENFIKRKGINFYEIEKRHINSLDILLYCAYNIINTVFKGYFYTEKTQINIFTEIYMKSFNRVIKGDFKLLNDKKILTPSEYFKIERP